MTRKKAGPDDVKIRRLLIVGAGSAGFALCRDAKKHPELGYFPVGFIDDDPRKRDVSLLGTRYLGNRHDIPQVVTDQEIDTIVIAIPSASPGQIRGIIEQCRGVKVPVRTLPSVKSILDGNVSVNMLQEVEITDLLGRDPVELDRDAIRKSLHGKRVLITGAAGSIGSELASQVAITHPEMMVLLDHAENHLFFLEAEIRDVFPDLSFVALVADVSDEVAIARVFSEYRPHVVFHAAAHKHVPLMERTPAEAVRNNVGGTYCVLRNAQDAGVETFVLVSTDKAVNPSSIMGATKRLAELMVQEMDSSGNMRALSVRFGNVLGTNASVVPIFKQQIANGGPVTVTHRNAQRYFMSISEAVGLILQAGSVATRGAIFIMEMGEPVNILGLAEMMISLSGLKPYEDIEVVFTGLRPGEKLQEELHLASEIFAPTQYEKLLVLKGDGYGKGVVQKVEEFLHELPVMEIGQVRSRLNELVPEYQIGYPLTDIAE